MHRIIRFKKDDDSYFGLTDLEYIYDMNFSEPLKPLPGKKVCRFDEVTLLSPCQPGKIVGVAINYRGATGVVEKMKEPLVFIKPPTSISSHDGIIRSPFKDTAIWGECELAVVIGKRAKNIQPEETDEYIIGYTIANDVTADNIHHWDHHLARSKGVDTFCPLGPWIDTTFKPENQLIEGYHNNELLRKGSLDERLFKEKELIALISGWMTLEPWDVILTGTPPRIRERRYLQPGDVFTCRIEGLGQMENKVEAAW